MFKLFAAILICSACMSPVAEGSVAEVLASSSPVHRINPALIDHLGLESPRPLLTPNVGPLTSLLAAALPPRTYIGQSNPVLVRTPTSTNFRGESSIVMIVV